MTVPPGDGLERALLIAALTALVRLSGLLRRTHQRHAAETAALLEQTRAAQDERARAAALEASWPPSTPATDWRPPRGRRRRPSTTDPHAVEVALVGTVREAFVNAARHAPGATLGVVLAFCPDEVSVTVHSGDPVAAPTAGGAAGHGPTGMRERLELVGGRLVAGPDGSGWAVVAEVPET